MNQSNWAAWSRSAVAAAVAVVVAAPALAQNTTSAIAGRITSADGKAVANATVGVLHVDSGSLTNVVTDADGRFQARGLRVGGPYTVTVTKDGSTERREGVFLMLAETLALDMSLGATQTITITGASDKFNSGAMGAGTNINSRALAAAPTIGRTLQDVARTDPRVSQTDKERGEISVAGQNSRFNSITIDGVTINDTFGLKANNLPTIKQPISLDAIESVQINVSNYDVTQKGYTGANINAVTKSGTNEFKGSVYYTFRDQDFAGDRFNATNGTYTAPPDSKTTLKGFTLGGPILKDKLFFFANYEEYSSTKTAPSYGPLGGGKTNVGITQSAVDQAAAIASTYGINAGTIDAQNTITSVKDTLLKLDWNISDAHRANVRYTKTEQTDPQFNNINSSALSFSSNWHNQIDKIETLVGQWFADWTDTFSTEFKVSRRDYESVPDYSVRSPQVTLNFAGALPAGTPSSVNSTRSLFLGTERSRHFNELRTKTDDLYLAGTLILGPHELKFGGDYSRNEIFNAFLQDTFGNYTFRCLDAAAANAQQNRPQVSYNFNNNDLNFRCNAATGAQIEQAVLENFQRGRYSNYTLQAPRAAGLTLQDGAANWTLVQKGLFLQDTWTVNKQLTLVGGLRVDQQSPSNKPIANTAFQAAPGAPNATTGRATGGFGLDNTNTLDDSPLVQPRFGFNLALNAPEERRMQLRGGFGLFQGAAASVWLSNPYSNTGAAVASFSCTNSGSPLCPFTDGSFNPNPDTQAAPGGTPPAPNVDLVAAGIKQPSVWKANLAFESELPWYGLVAGAEWLHTSTKDGIYYRHLNLGTPTRTGTDGRELYWTNSGYLQTCWNNSGTSVGGTNCPDQRSRALSNAGWGNVLLADTTKKGGGDALTLSLSQPARDGFGWNAAYTRTTSKEVSPLTSSTSNSNWNGRAVFNPNEEVASNSSYLVRDRVSAGFTFSKPLLESKYRTTVGLFYEGRSGKPYSWTFDNDLNGDGISGNDLMYIPSGRGSGEVVFTGLGEDAFWNVVEAYPELNGKRGSVVGRNTGRAPWVNTFDMRLSQELPGFTAKHKATVTFDILNLGNLLNPRWGRTNEIAFQNGGSARSFVRYQGLDANGRYVYNVIPTEPYEVRQAAGESQWSMQITLRYEF